MKKTHGQSKKRNKVVKPQDAAKPHQQQSISADLFQLLQRAVAFHQVGNLDDAESLYKTVMSSNPNNVDVLNLLGTLYFQRGNAKDAVPLLEKATKLNPNYADAHNNLANALNQLQRYNDALKSYEKAVALKPGYADAHYNYASILDHLHRYNDALASYDKALAINPNHVQAYYNRGNVLHRLKRYNEALASYDKAIALNPHFADTYGNRGSILNELRQYDEALISFDKAIALNPHHIDSYNSRGMTLYNLKRYEEAFTSLDRAITINPNYSDAYNNRGNILNHLHKYDEALANFDKAIAIKPDFAEAYYNRGNILSHFNQYNEALLSFDKAISSKPEYAKAYWNKSLLKLLLGEFEDGWKLYEWRVKGAEEEAKPKNILNHLWLGKESLKGKTILLQAEQGLGDTIQFCRYAPIVAALGAKVILEVQQPLVDLISTVQSAVENGIKIEVISQGIFLPQFDFHCPLMSLPLAFGTTIATIPHSVPYLSEDKGKQKIWQERLGNKTKPRIGLVWSGNAKHKNDHNRSIALSRLTPLLENDFEFHALQTEVKQTDQTTLTQSKIIAHADNLKDFSDTAALISEMDLIISVDTSVAHLTGALNKPVWVLLPFAPDFRWLLDREDSPWYPTARLFRQQKIGDWESVIMRVKKELELQSSLL